jgi:thiol-disulfide isomerase/thioredoxin
MLSMGKADRNKAQSARARIAEQQAQQRRLEKRRRILAVSAVGVVVLVVIGVIVGLEVSKSTPKQATAGQLPSSVQAKLTVPGNVLATVGTGSTSAAQLKTVRGPALTANGKPEMLYIGAEWCPYCAAERWAMAVALSRFGTFGPLKGIHSSAIDVYPNTATLSFYRAKYTSKYLVFTPVETEDTNRSPLQTPTTAQRALWKKYDPPGNTFPFINIGNRYVAETTYDPQVLQGLTWSQIATDLHNPLSPVAKGAVGSANLFTAAICKITGNAPASVCTTAPVSALEGKI